MDLGNWADEVNAAEMGMNVDIGMAYVPPHLTEHALVADSQRTEFNDFLSSESAASDVLNYTHMNSICVHRIDVALCAKCKGKGKAKGHKTPWLLDSGASKHFTNNLSDFVDYTAWPESKHRTLSTATSKSKVIGSGTCILRTPDLNGDYHSVRIEGVRYVPDLNTRLLSLGVFLNDGMTVSGKKGHLILKKNNKTFMVFEPRSEGDTLYGVNSSELSEEVAQTSTTVNSVDFDIMHRRLAHPSDEVLKHARKHTQGFPDVIGHRSATCRGCAQGKMPNRSFPVNLERAKQSFDLIHSDLKSFPIESYHKYKYVMTFFDDYSSHAWTKLLKRKSEAAKAARQFIQMVKTQFGVTIKQWKCDQGTEYLNKELIETFSDEGIVLIPSPPYAHQVNGRAERFMRTMMDKAESMRHLADAPESWWEFSIEYAIHIYNRTPLKRHKWKTPFEAIHNKKPSIDHLRVFGCAAYVYTPSETRPNKMAPKSELMTFIGWGPSGYIFMDSSNRTKPRAHALFDETVFPRSKHAPRPKQKETAGNRYPTHSPQIPTIILEDDSDDDGLEPPSRQPPPSKKGGVGSSPDGGSISSNLPKSNRVGPSTPPAQTIKTETPFVTAPQAPSKGKSVSFIDKPDSSPSPSPSRPPTPECEGPRRSSRLRKETVKPDNVYGKSKPTDVLKTGNKAWSKQVGIASQSRKTAQPQPTPAMVPVPSSAPPANSPGRTPLSERLRSVTTKPPGSIGLSDIGSLRAPAPQRSEPDTSASGSQLPDVSRMAQEG
jgi:transposase InsO family protein